MKIALIGNGKMGRLVAEQATLARHEIGAIVSSTDAAMPVDELAARLRDHDVAIDFSVAAAVEKNVTACAHAGVALVEGTTGWAAQQTAVCKIAADHQLALVYGANFSVGVNVFYRVVSQAAELFAKTDSYAPFIEEAHHERKKDAPSGTALKLRDVMKERMSREIPIASTRAGSIPGTHRVGFDSDADQVVLTHTARSRAGFAAGALLAANWIKNRKGVYEFSDIIMQMMNDER
jgi:4-hydroxy-tetrahydrodipicolinate reductase